MGIRIQICSFRDNGYPKLVKTRLGNEYVLFSKTNGMLVKKIAATAFPLFSVGYMPKIEERSTRLFGVYEYDSEGNN